MKTTKYNLHGKEYDNDCKVKIDIQNDKCRLCGGRDERVNHIINCHVMAHGDEEVGMILPPVELTLSRSQKVTVRRECGSRRCSHLSDLGSPDIGRGKRKWSQMIGGDPKRKWGSLPLSGSKYKKGSFLSKSRGRRTIAILLRAKDKRLTETWRTPKSFTPVQKTEQSLLAREKRKILQWNPVKKNKISNFGTFFLYTQILFTTLSLFEEG